jgi:hypothetical protein
MLQHLADLIEVVGVIGGCAELASRPGWSVVKVTFL